MSTKYPKIWTGSSNPGESLVRELQRNEAPFLTARGTDYVARKKGEFVHVETGGEDGLYSLGRIVAGDYMIRASPNYRAAFSSRGAFAGSAFALPNLLYVGGGQGVVPRIRVSSGYQTAELLTSRQGKSFTSRVTLPSSYSPVPHPYNLLNVVLGAYAPAGDGGAWAWGAVSMFFTGGAHQFLYTFTLDGGRTWASNAVTMGADFRHGHGMADRMSPTEILAIVPSYGPTDFSNPDNLYVEYPSMLLYTGNNGVTWQLVNAGALFTDMDSYDVSFDHQALAGFVNRVSMGGLSNGEVLAVVPGSPAHNPYNPAYTGTFDLTEVRIIVYVGSSPSSPNFQQVARLPPVGGQVYFRAYAPTLVGNTPVFQAYDASGDAASSGPKLTPHCLYVGSLNGRTWEPRLLPWPAYKTGVIRVLGPDILAVSVFDDADPDERPPAIRMFVSNDLGLTWKRGPSIIKTGGFVPSSTGRVLGNFGAISMLRRDGKPAPTFPGAPWIGDYRRTPPWLEDE